MTTKPKPTTESTDDARAMKTTTRKTTKSPQYSYEGWE